MTTKETKDNKLDIFYTLGEADKRNMNMLADLDEDLRGKFAPLVVMRWFSTLSNSSPYCEYQLTVVNEIVNKNFWELSKHPELQWKLMAACGVGTKQRHNWIPMAKRQTNTKLEEFLLQFYPNYNEDELRILINGFTEETFKEFVQRTGTQDNEVKEKVKLYKDYCKAKTKA